MPPILCCYGIIWRGFSLDGLIEIDERGERLRWRWRWWWRYCLMIYTLLYHRYCIIGYPLVSPHDTKKIKKLKRFPNEPFFFSQALPVSSGNMRYVAGRKGYFQLILQLWYIQLYTPGCCTVYRLVCTCPPNLGDKAASRVRLNE